MICYCQCPMGQRKTRPRALTLIQQPQAAQRLPVRWSHVWQISRRRRYCWSSTMPQPSPTKATTDWKRFDAWVVSGGSAGSPRPYSGEGQGVREEWTGATSRRAVVERAAVLMVPYGRPWSAGKLPAMTMVTPSPPDRTLLILPIVPRLSSRHNMVFHLGWLCIPCCSALSIGGVSQYSTL